MLAVLAVVSSRIANTKFVEISELHDIVIMLSLSLLHIHIFFLRAYKGILANMLTIVDSVGRVEKALDHTSDHNANKVKVFAFSLRVKHDWFGIEQFTLRLRDGGEMVNRSEKLLIGLTIAESLKRPAHFGLIN